MKIGLRCQDNRIDSRVTLQDVCSWGDQPQLISNEDMATSIHEAWFRLELDSLQRWNLKGAQQEITYAASDHWIPTLGYEILSGNDLDKPRKLTAFTPFYGTNHKFNEHLDYFYVGNHKNYACLMDIYLKSVHPAGKTKLGANLHCFRSQTRVIDPANLSAELAKSLGTEIDLFVNRKINNLASIQTGYSQMFPTSTMEVLKSGSKDATTNWFYVMFTVTQR